MTWALSPLRPLKYGVILADPPWRFRTWGEHNQQKSASKHYPLMTMEALQSLPVNRLATDPCVLVMWAVQSMIPQALDLMRAWGFRFKTMGSWAKQSSSRKGWSLGTGHMFRCSAEFFVVGVIGKPKISAHDVRNLIVAPVREHSRKPDEMHVNLERLFPDVKRAELFGRERRLGWDVWGNESTKFNGGEL